jgi:xanthine dehydrogenase/oxidase
MDAMKTFAIDEKPIDIEDLSRLKCCQNSKTDKVKVKKLHIINANNADEWLAPKTLDELYSLLNQSKSLKYRFVGGNTGVGVYKNEGKYQIFIDVKNVPNLFSVEKKPAELTIGSAVTLTSLIEILNQHSTSPGFEYLSVIAFHIVKIANVGVRNTSTWGGNLAMKNRHHDFPSDVFISFLAVNAQLKIIGPDHKLDHNPIQVNLEEFLKVDLNGKFIYSVTFKPLDKQRTYLKTFKIMPRYRNAHAYVNAGFCLNINPATSEIDELPNIVYGGINSTFIHAKKTEAFLKGKKISDQIVIDEAFKILSNEIEPEYDPALSSIEYRKSLALALFYKVVLYCNDKHLNARYKSGQDSVMDIRPVSSSKQIYPGSDLSLMPVTKGISKLNAYYQTSGDSPYVYDLKPFPNQLYGVFIQSALANCDLVSINYDEALKMPGVVKVLLAKDIPGKNNVVFPSFLSASPEEEPLFAHSHVSYAGQAIGMVVAETHEQATEAAKHVDVKYANIRKPILTIKEAIEANSFHDQHHGKDFTAGDPSKAIDEAELKLDGEFFMDGQYHFYLESQVSIVNRCEDQYDVYSSTQWTDAIQNAVTQILGLESASFVNVQVKQLGGSYGGKIIRSNIPAAAAALACNATNKAVRVALDMSTVMEMIGKRSPYYAKYKVGFNKSGKILGVQMQVFIDNGYTRNDSMYHEVFRFFDNAYNIGSWHIDAKLVKTNTATNTACRSPGMLNRIFFPSSQYTTHMPNTQR